MLNARQIRFRDEYLVDFNGTQAAIRAGYSPVSAAEQAFELLRNPAIFEAIEERKEELAIRAGLTVEWVLRQWKMIAYADPNELIYTQLDSCRHCHSKNHEYHWSEFEYRKAVEVAATHLCGPKCEEPCLKRVPPIPIGGFGYDPHQAPAAACPVCHGRGIERVCMVDTRRVTGPARRLYAGVKQTQHGIEIKMRDQDAALKNIAQYLGMVIDKREMAGPNGAPIPVANFSAKDLSDNQLAQIILQE